MIGLSTSSFCRGTGYDTLVSSGPQRTPKGAAAFFRLAMQQPATSPIPAATQPHVRKRALHAPPESVDPEVIEVEAVAVNTASDEIVEEVNESELQAKRVESEADEHTAPPAPPSTPSLDDLVSVPSASPEEELAAALNAALQSRPDPILTFDDSKTLGAPTRLPPVFAPAHQAVRARVPAPAQSRHGYHTAPAPAQSRHDHPPAPPAVRQAAALATVPDMYAEGDGSSTDGFCSSPAMHYAASPEVMTELDRTTFDEVNKWPAERRRPLESLKCYPAVFTHWQLHLANVPMCGECAVAGFLAEF